MSQVALTAAAPNPNNIFFRNNISPEEAQQYLNSPPFTEPQLSGRTSERRGPTRGNWRNGQEIGNLDDNFEEVYEASQFHGQDGLGAYGYGYKTPQSSKVENRARSGDLAGSYTYKAGNDDIKVRYWQDSEGFHQIDNLPKNEQNTQDVYRAHLADERAWQKAVAATTQQQYPQGEYSAQYDYQPSASEQQGVNYQRFQYGQQQQNRPQRAPQQYGQQQQYGQRQQYGKQQQYRQQQQYGQNQVEEPEPNGPRGGFFYSFKYPVSVNGYNDQRG